MPYARHASQAMIRVANDAVRLRGTWQCGEIAASCKGTQSNSAFHRVWFAETLHEDLIDDHCRRRHSNRAIGT